MKHPISNVFLEKKKKKKPWKQEAKEKAFLTYKSNLALIVICFIKDSPVFP
jgi:hypothetical protein